MGRAAREKPIRLPEKLFKIRNILGLSQNQMLEELGMSDKVFRSAISGFELGTREPTLIILLKYARLTNLCLDYLIDDALDIPENLPDKVKHIH